MNLVREIQVTIKRASFTAEVTVQVQAGAPVDLTCSLGFLFLVTSADASSEELLQGDRKPERGGATACC